MKKYLVKLVAFTLSFVLCFSLIFVLPTGAATQPLRESCVTDHFATLKKYKKKDTVYVTPVPPNMDGTCVFVSMSMLLSFYDSYWRDDFVVNSIDGLTHEMGWTRGEYDSSTDTLNKTFESYLERDAWEYSTDDVDEFVENNKDLFLQSYLIDMQKELPFYDQPGELEFQARDALEYYLYNKCGFDSDKITVNLYKAYDLNNDRETMISIAKEQIDNGNPVIFMGLDADFIPESVDGDSMFEGGHAMIGFDTFVNDDGQDDIRLHLGYNWSNPYSSIRESGYTLLNSIIWLDVNEENLPHVCTDNYYDVHTGNNVCSCYIYYNTHPGHQSHNYQFNDFNSQSHYLRCYCDARTNVVGHSITYSYYTPVQHYKRCGQCIYFAYEDHEYNIPQSSTSAEGHTLGCVCGQTTSAIEAHYEHTYISQSKLLHNVYCKCGYFLYSLPHQMVSVGTVNKCRDCGFVGSGGLLPPGQIITGVEDENDVSTE